MGEAKRGQSGRALMMAGIAALALSTAEPSEAQTNSGVPAGAVMMFDGPSCPAGWTDFAPTKGRAVIGLPDNPYKFTNHPTNLTTRGVALAGPDKAHYHNVSLIPKVTPAGEHFHTTGTAGTQHEGIAAGFGKAAHTSHKHSVGWADKHTHSSTVKGGTSSKPLSDILPYVFIRFCRKS